MRIDEERWTPDLSNTDIIKSRVKQHVRPTPTGKLATVHQYERTGSVHALAHPSDPEAWIGVDFDGTLASDTGKYDALGFSQPGPPVPAMLARVQRWIKEGRKVKILSARGKDEANTKIVHDWLAQYGLPVLPITTQKDGSMTALYDDRAVAVEKNTGRLFHDIQEDYSGRIGRHRPVDINGGTS